MSFSEKLFELFTPSSSSNGSVERDPGILDLLVKRKSEVARLVHATMQVAPEATPQPAIDFNQAAIDMGRVAQKDTPTESPKELADSPLNFDNPVQVMDTAQTTPLKPTLNFSQPSVAMTDAEKRAQAAMQAINEIDQPAVSVADIERELANS